MRKLTTNDMDSGASKINVNNKAEKKNAIVRVWLYGGLSLLFGIITIICLVKGMYTECAFGVVCALLFGVWSNMANKALKPAEVIVFLDKKSNLYHYSPDCSLDKESLYILLEKKAAKKGKIVCPQCLEALDEK